MNLSDRKKEALNKLENENIHTSISSKYIEQSSDETVEKMAETFINFFENFDKQEKDDKNEY